MIRVKWQYKYLIGTCYPNKIAHTKSNEYTGQMNLLQNQNFWSSTDVPRIPD